MIKALVFAAGLSAGALPVLAQAPVATAPAPAAGATALVGAGEADVRTRLGQPDVARREGRGAMWTYRRPTCSVFVFFQDRPGEGLKVSSVSAGPRSLSEAAPSLDACLAASPAG